MKTKIKPFIQRLIRENIFYIFGNVFILILIVVSVRIGLSENLNYNKKISALKTELSQLQNKITLMNTVIPSTESLDEDLNFLNTLIPNVEDYFSIIYSLEKLSQKSNFIITEYSVDVNKSTTQKLKLSVIGVGESQTFINFLKDYNFGGGRLITSDKIQIDPNFFGSIKIDLTFYAKSVLTDKNLGQITDYKFFEELEALKSKVNFSFTENIATDSADLEYPKKTNPF